MTLRPCGSFTQLCERVGEASIGHPGNFPGFTPLSVNLLLNSNPSYISEELTKIKYKSNNCHVVKAIYR